MRATTVDIIARVQRRIGRDASTAAGNNALVARGEQAQLPDQLMKDAADELRAEGGAGTRVDVSELKARATSKVGALLGQVNQPSGPGAAFVSEREVVVLFTLDADAGRRVARAYELITGKRVVLPAPVDGPEVPVDVPVAPIDVPVAPPSNGLSAARVAQITARAVEVANSGDMDIGDVQTRAPQIVLAIDVPGSPRTHNVHIFIRGRDPNTVERMLLRSVDADGVVRTATFDVPV